MTRHQDTKTKLHKARPSGGGCFPAAGCRSHLDTCTSEPWAAAIGLQLPKDMAQGQPCHKEPRLALGLSTHGTTLALLHGLPGWEWAASLAAEAPVLSRSHLVNVTAE